MSDTGFAAKLQQQISEHAGWTHLEKFGANLKAKPLSRDALKVFLASTAEFFKEIPGGILALAVRVTDDFIEKDRFNAVSHGARVLYSAVDEYGLHDTGKGFQKSHHELFKDMAEMWGVSLTELLDKKFILPQATELAKVTNALYRSRSVAEGVGFHFASEKTSDREFHLCMQGFNRHWASYDLKGESDPTLNFYYIHTLVEPMHGSTSADTVNLYAEQSEAMQSLVLAGAAGFMESYGQFWAALNKYAYAS